MQTPSKTDYDAQADRFLSDTGTTLNVEFLRLARMPFDADKDPPRAIYRFTLARGQRNYSAEFGQSYQCSAKFWLYGNYKRGQSMTRGVYGWILGADGHKPHTATRDWELNKSYAVPGAYDILACIDGYCADTFDEFCADYGYDTDSRNAERAYNAVKAQAYGLRALYSDSELDALAEIA